KDVIAAAGVANDPQVRAWALRSARKYPGMTPYQEASAFLVDYLRTAVTIKRDKGDVFQILVADYAPERARRLAESVANQFVLSSKASQLEMVRATQGFSSDQQKLYKARLEDSEARLEAATRASLGAGEASEVTSNDLPRAQGLAQQADLE